MILEKARELKENGDLYNAEAVLKKYHTAVPKDFDATWLYAQTAAQNKNYDMAILIYQEALALRPRNYDLKLDFAQMLMKINEFDMADTLADQCLRNNPELVDALIIKAKTQYRLGEYDETSVKLSKILKSQPENPDALYMKESITTLKRSWLKFDFSYFEDSQPLQRYLPVLQGGVYLGGSSTMYGKIQSAIFQKENSNKNVYSIELGSTTIFGEYDIDFTIAAGVIKFPEVSPLLTGKLSLDRRIERNFIFSVYGEREPYLLTRASVDTSLMVNTFGTSLVLKSKEDWATMGKVEVKMFDKENLIYTFYANLLSPQIKYSDFDIKLGYGFGYNGSKLDKFTQKGRTLAGEYKPYFSPQTEFVNWGIASVILQPRKDFQAELNINYGFFTSAERPYFYLQTDSIGRVSTEKAFIKESFSPLDVNLLFLIQASEKISLTGEFNYSKTFFYTRRFFGAGMRINFK